MKFLIPALVLSACLPAAFSQEQIIPKPAEITVFHGKPAQLTPASAIITATQDKAFLNRARQLQQMLGEGTGLPLPLKTPGEAPENAACIIIKKDPALAAKGEEAYSIQSSPRGIILSAAHAKGIFYAGQSLIQMMPVIFHDRKADKSAVQWNISGAPLEIRTKGKKIPDWNIYNGSAGPLPYSIPAGREIKTSEEDIMLIPYGCTTLRIAEFPILGKYVIK